MIEKPQTIYLEPKETYDQCILKIEDGIVYYCVDSILNILIEDSLAWIKDDSNFSEDEEEYKDQAHMLALEWFDQNIYNAYLGYYTPRYVFNKEDIETENNECGS